MAAGCVAPGSSRASRDRIVTPSTWRCALCPSRGEGGVAGADYPLPVALVASLLLEEELEHNPTLGSPSSEDEDEVWDAESLLVSLVKSISPFPVSFFWCRS